MCIVCLNKVCVVCFRFVCVYKIGAVCSHKSVCLSKMCAVCFKILCVCVLRCVCVVCVTYGPWDEIVQWVKSHRATFYALFFAKFLNVFQYASILCN